MCGVVGIAVRNRSALVSQSEVDSMASTLAHRGPDGQAMWIDERGRCGLGHTRLKVIDLETGDQPIGNETGEIQVVFNGEIYNFRSLRDQLRDRGHEFATASDTEVLVHGYEEWGEAFASRLEGMFAFAIWDSAKARLVLGRDRAGQKPLFIYEDAQRVAFASETQAIRGLSWVQAGFREEIIPAYLTFGYVPTPGTFHEGVRKLKPGHTAVYEFGREVVERSYWEPTLTTVPIDFAEACERVRDGMRTAVERRLVSDVPLGAFLSGGLDSSIVVATMTELMSEPVKTFSIGFEGDDNFDETHYAKQVADHFGTDHTVHRVGPQSMDLLDRLVDAHDEPFGDSSAIPTFIVSSLARESVTVCLTGDGGDELFAGYLRFLGTMVADRIPRWALGIAGFASNMLPHNDDFRSIPRRVERFLRVADRPPESRLTYWTGLIVDELREGLVPEISDRVDTFEMAQSLRDAMDPWASEPLLKRVLAANYRTYLLDDLLVKSDRCSMSHGLELRSPFLDTDLTELAFSFPSRTLIKGRTLKHVLREAFRDRIPLSVIERSKWGFGVPLATWFRGDWKALLTERLLDPDARISRWVKPRSLQLMVDRHMAGEVDFGLQFWALLTLETWLHREGLRP
jgi:asparagine synthase (glutamine-hydrolysing)